MKERFQPGEGPSKGLLRDCEIFGEASFEALTCIATWALVWMLLGSPLSLPQLHFTVCPATSVLCVATIACAADSFVENLKQIKCYKYYRTIPRVKLFK